MSYLCLVLGGQASLSDAIVQSLRGFDIKAHVAATCEQAMAMAAQWHFDAFVVDADAFGLTACSVVNRVHAQVAGAPIVVLTSERDERSQLASLESGAVDVLTKPTSAYFVAAKLRRLIDLLHHAIEPVPGEDIVVGALTLQPRTGCALVGGRQLDLTVHQFELLCLLASRPGRMVARETISHVLRGPAKSVGRSPDVHVYRIRKWLRDHAVPGLRIETGHGRGYCLVVDAAESVPDRVPESVVEQAA